MSLTLSEKYRPRKFDDLISNKVVKNMFNNIISSANIPNLIFYGGPGTGKTSALKVFINEIYSNNSNDNILEINASDDRGINIELILTKFSQTMIGNNLNKIIIFDEANDIAKKVQNIICKFINGNDDTNRIRCIFICQHINNIIESIQSRCNIVDFNRIHKDLILERLELICKKENIKYEDPALENIAFFSNGDMRASLNLVEQFSIKKDGVTLANIESSNLFPSRLILRNIILYCANKNITEAYHEREKLKGFEANDIINNLLDLLMYDSMLIIDEKIKLTFYDIIAQTLYVISQGIQTDLQIDAMLAILLKA